MAIVTTDASEEANLTLLDTIEAQYSLPREAIGRRPTNLSTLEKLVHAGEIDAVLAFGRFDSPQISEIVQILSHSVTPPEAPVFIPILESNAIAKKFPGLEATNRNIARRVWWIAITALGKC